MRPRSRAQALRRGPLIRLQGSTLGAAEARAAAAAVRSGDISGDAPQCRALEKAVRSLTGARHAFFTTSATAAVEMALLAFGIGPGDDVVLPSFSFVSVAAAVARTGARPVFCDVDPGTLNADAGRFGAALTRRTRLLIPVHYAGHSCELDGILELAARAGARVLEDAAQAVGSRYRGRHLGTLGHAACLSLQGSKNVGCGEGGLLLTDDGAVARAVELIRDKGTDRADFMRGKTDHYSWRSLGGSFAQSGLLAAVALEQLRRREALQRRRQANAERLARRLAALAPALTLQRTLPRARPNWHIFAALLPDRRARDRFIALMRERGVEASSHFVPLHLSPFARQRLGGRPGSLPATESVCDRLVRLPVHPSLGPADMDPVASAAEDAVAAL